MKKIPTLFKREFKGHNVVQTFPCLNIPEPQGSNILLYGKPTIKYDGACCMIANGVFYKRYDAKQGKTPPPDSIPCQPEPDPVTGHWPCWVPVNPDSPADKWFIEAWNNSRPTHMRTVVKEIRGDEMLSQWVRDDYEDGTYEAVGLHFQGNPYNLTEDCLYKHGAVEITDLERTFDGVKRWLRQHNEEGIVFWDNDEGPLAKIKRSDFGLPWNQKNKE